MKRGERGFALVITLVITALLVALTVQFVDDVFVETSSAQNFIDGQQASLMANSGIELSRLIITTQPEFLLQQPLATPYKKEDEKGALLVTIEDESGKLNINKIVWANQNDFSYHVLKRLLHKIGVPEQQITDLLDALSDWIDEDDEPKGSAGGAESSYYLKQKPPYRAKNKTLQTVEELRLVKGFDAQLIDRLKRYITVYGSGPVININTAPLELVASLLDDMTAQQAQCIIEERIKKRFTGTGEITSACGLGSASIGLSTNLSYKSTIFRLYSEAKVNETNRAVEAVVDTQSTLYWREY